MTAVDDKLAIARAIVRDRAPYLMSMILSLVPYEQPGIGTLGVSPSLVLVFDPEWILTIGNEECAGALVHECSHILRDHFERSSSFADKDMWNKAADLAINPDMFDANWKLPHSIVPDQYGFPKGLTAEQYYEKLEELSAKQQKQQGGKGSGGAGGGSTGGGKGKQKGQGQGQDPADPHGPGRICAGSCGGVTGNSKQQETEAKADQSVGRTDAEVQAAKIQTAADIKAHAEAHGRGSIPGGWLEIADKVLEPPKIAWKNKLRYLLRKVTGQIKAGGRDYSLRRPSKRSFTRGMIRPGLVERKPVLAFILDTSGSMGLQTQIKASIREAVGVLRALGLEDVYFLQADFNCQGKTQKVRLPTLINGFQIQGRGGTSFVPAIEEIQKLKPRPNLVMYWTDGDGDAPPTPPKGMEFIWCIIKSYYNKAPASWGHVVHVDELEEGPLTTALLF